MIGKIFVVATPIGNLEDITLRGLRVLKEADFILAEDTRISAKLLRHYQIRKPLLSFWAGMPKSKLAGFINLLSQGKDLAVITDAGTPNISDPGHILIRTAVDEFGGQIDVVAIPGPSALTAIVSISHFSVDDFVFLGFPPSKKGRQKFFGNLVQDRRPVIFYESTHRILRTVSELAKLYPSREMIIAKELTKKFEKVWRGQAAAIYQELLKAGPEKLKGEFVLALSYGQK